MEKALKFELTVKPENLEKVKALLESNKELFIRTLWNKTEVFVV